MLPSLGFQEILLLAVLALVVVGPKDLPLMLRKLGRWTARLRGMAQEFRTGFDELARQAELDELRKEVDALRKGAPFNDLVNEITKPAVLPGTLAPPAPPAPEASPEETPSGMTELAPTPAPPAPLEEPAEAAPRSAAGGAA